MTISRIAASWLAALAAVFSLGAAAVGLDIKMATTTSTDNSGLLHYLLPKYEAKCHCKVRYTAVGTGNAIKLGENGDVDMIMVHARAAEDKFVAEGHGVNRRDLMYNDFVIVGPHSDPAHIRGMKDLQAALKKLKSSNATFVSRGDDSGTNKKELGLWKEAGVDPNGPNYLSIGQGMGQTLTVTSEKQGYTLTDRATYATYKDKTGLEIMVEGSKNLLNPYGVIAVNPKKYPGVNYTGAMHFIDWLTSHEGQQVIASYQPKGAQLFFPDYRKK
ncbi:MAG TPA: substrate-binding domain-containing protein [Burkholderiales bacterium]|nr:substrate-binding domain-containing protein [Burkholderiales bacterium]